MRKSGRPKKRIQRKKGTVRIKEFNKRIRLSTEEYEKIFFEEIKLDSNGNQSFVHNKEDDSPFILEKIEEHKRIYSQNPNSKNRKGEL